MKKIFKYTLVLVLAFGPTSCDKLFDSLEGDLTLMTLQYQGPAYDLRLLLESQRL